MKRIPNHIYSTELEFINQSTKLVCFRITIPLKKNIHCLSKWYKILKQAIASSENVPTLQIKGKHNIIKSELEDRILFEWRGGVSLDVPDNVTARDYKIILAQLEVIKMSVNRWL